MSSSLSKQFAEAAQHQRGGRDSVAFNFQRARQAVLQLYARRGFGGHQQLDAHFAGTRLPCDVGYFGGDLAVLSPRKTIEPQMGLLPGSNSSEGVGRRECGDGSQLAVRDHRANLVPLADDLAGAQVRHFAEGAAGRRDDEALIDFVLQTFNSRSAGFDLAFDNGGVPFQTFERRLLAAVPRALVFFLAIDGDAQRVPGGSASFGFGFGPNQFGFGDQTVSAQRFKPSGFIGGGARAGFGFFHFGARFIDRDRRGLTGFALDLPFSGGLAAERGELPLQRGHTRLLFGQLQSLRFGLQLDQRVAGFDLAPHFQTRGRHATANQRFDWARGAINFQARFSGRFVQRDLGQPQPRQPAAQQYRHNQYARRR